MQSGCPGCTLNVLLLCNLKCDLWTKRHKILWHYWASWSLLTRCKYIWFCFPIRPHLPVNGKKVFILNKENKWLHGLMMEWTKLVICWPHLRTTVTWIWPECNVVFLSKGNFTLTCKAQSAAACECGKVQVWVIPRRNVLDTLTALSRTIKYSLVCWADMNTHRNSEQLWKRRCNLWTP